MPFSLEDRVWILEQKVKDLREAMKGKKYIYDPKTKKVVPFVPEVKPMAPAVRISASNRLEGAAVRR